MLRLDNAIILSSKAPDKAVNVTLSNGLTTLGYNQRYLYEFLKLDNQALDQGSFYVDDNAIVPLEDKKNSLFLLSIDSQDIVISACYILTKENETKGIIANIKDKERKEKIKEIESSFLSLKDMPLDTPNEHHAKLEAIFAALLESKPSYILLNWNNEVNQASRSLLEPLLGKYSSNLTIIALEASKHQKKAILGDLLSKKEKKSSKKKEESYSVIQDTPEETVPVSPNEEAPKKKEPIFTMKPNTKSRSHHKDSDWTEIDID